jgi:uncharacterized protein (DUF4213/DUF364 family)
LIMPGFAEKTLLLSRERTKGMELPKTRGVLIGRKFQAVLLNGYLGLAYAPRGEVSETCKITANPGTLHRIAADELAGLVLSGDAVERCLGFAALNALSQFVIDREVKRYNIYYGLDTLKHLRLDKDTKAGMIGFIGPFIPYLARNTKSLLVLDKNPGLEPGPQAGGFTLIRNAEELADRDVVIITGSTIVEHSLEEVMDITRNAGYRIVIGPTASWLPEVAFEMGIDAVAGMKFTDTDAAFRVIMEGGGTRDFSRYADKYTITSKAL